MIGERDQVPHQGAVREKRLREALRRGDSREGEDAPSAEGVDGMKRSRSEILEPLSRVIRSQAGCRPRVLANLLDEAGQVPPGIGPGHQEEVRAAKRGRWLAQRAARKE